MSLRARVIQSALAFVFVAGIATPAAASYTIEYNGSAHIKQIPSATGTHDERKFKHTFTNTGTETETYRMVIDCEYVSVDEFGHGWTMCNTIACVSPATESTITLAPAESDTVTIKALSYVTSGSSRAILTFEGMSTGTIQTFEYAILSEQCEVVVIDDSPGTAAAMQLVAGLEMAGVACGVFDTEVETLGDTSIDFSLANTVIYTSGDQTGSVLPMADRTALESFLDGGGTLLMSGQDLFDSIGGSSFASDYLGAVAFGETTETSVTGVTGDSIGDGLALTLDGSQISQNTLGGSTVFLRYGNGDGAAVRNNTGSYDAYSFGFGLEALSDADLSALMSAIAGGALPVAEMSWGAVKARFGR
jgi:hypothetical protein